MGHPAPRESKMADHVKTLRKRLERMERAEAQHPGRPINQRDRALADALRAAIKSMDPPRATGKHPALGAPYGALGEVAARLSDPPHVADLKAKFPYADFSRDALPPLDRDEHMDRDYIPFGGGWEIHTKGKGSTFRLVHVDPHDHNKFERYAVLDEHLHAPLTQMAYHVRAAQEKKT